MNRKRTFTATELDVACELQNDNVPVSQQAIDAVAQRLRQPAANQRPERNKYELYNEYHQAFPHVATTPQVQVMPRQHDYGEPIKRTHTTTTKIDHNHTANIKQVALFTVPIGLGTAILSGLFVDFLPAVGIGVVATGVVGYVASWQLATSANKYSDNAVQMSAQKYEMLCEKERQRTEQLRIQQHAKLSALQIAQQREAQELEQQRLQQRQQARLQASQRQIEYSNRTVSETHVRASEQAVSVDYGGFDDANIVDVQPVTSTNIVQSDPVLTPTINDAKEALLDWLGRVYEGNAFNDKGALVPKNIAGNGSAPWAQRGGYPKAIQTQIIEYIKSQRGGSDWLFQKHGNAYRLNTACFGSYEVIENHINNTWL